MELNRLPVFEIVGDRSELNWSFLERLTADLIHLDLFCITVSAEDVRCPEDVWALARKYDVVFVKSESGLFFQKISLLPAAAEKMEDGLSCVDGDESSFISFLSVFLLRLQELSRRSPLRGCILIGGKSSRMGQPKHLIKNDRGKSWLCATVDILKPLVSEIVISGAGEVPDSLSDLVRLTDIPGVGGPMSGFLSASRRYPLTNWLLIACDMPNISGDAVEWLLSYRLPGRWGVVPRMVETGYLEPLFAWYDMRAGQIFESQLQAGVTRIGRGAEHQKIENPIIPLSLRGNWKNINTPEQLYRERHPE